MEDEWERPDGKEDDESHEPATDVPAATTTTAAGHVSPSRRAEGRGYRGGRKGKSSGHGSRQENTQRRRVVAREVLHSCSANPRKSW